jgi:hypothetical protein
MFVKVIGRLMSPTVAVGRLVGRTASLMDADMVTDDHLCEGVVQEGGVVEFLFDLSAARGFDSFFEQRPDLYCIVRDADGTVIYRSATLPNVDFLTVDPVTDERRTTLELLFEEP